ncbi:hypothetical protein GCM10010992_22010 [Cloacibacterium rupense]|uniref:Transmembrane family 220, helix n=1 Tax=Cloacibacterium rupense TaxID=517423 RepID=A0ABQ2NM41_9FLAO|nr:hypothetical protein [Cloacibacterium rupense]GGP05536.1 hypothetical protein GCM10010992_22010 [Cloacibacterium rupense]
MIYLIGIAIELIFIGVMTFKLMIPPKLYFIFLLISFIIAFIGIYLRTYQNLLESYYLLIPFIFLVLYQLLRLWFKLFFGNEPILSGYLQSSWEQGEYRKLHFGDAIFTILLLFLPVIISGILVTKY